jgi:tetratricopeptide (TPR) repeat protein
VLSLGLIGRFATSNAAVARALKDQDPTVRNLAETALWAIWFRAGTPEENERLEAIRRLIGRRRLDEAIERATALIAAAPDFAEAYNQRAIAYAFSGRLAESIQDCRRVLERNPYHLGALNGMAGCYRMLHQPVEALKALRRALRIQPYSDSLKGEIQSLEAEIESGSEPDGAR